MRAMGDSDLQMSFLDHLGELRTRLLRILASLAVGFVIAYVFRRELFGFLTIPFNNAYQAVFNETPQLITTGLVESFLVYLKVGLLGGLFLSLPYIFFQLWGFISPGLRDSERKHVIPFVLLATIFFAGGAIFGYTIVFPLGFEYFLRVAPGDYVQPMIRMSEYYSLASWMLLVFGLTFEAPLFVLYLAFFGILSPKQLIEPWRGVIVGIVVASALLTPADPASMILLAIPLLLLYGITILVSFLISRKRQPEPSTPSSDA